MARGKTQEQLQQGNVSSEPNCSTTTQSDQSTGIWDRLCGQEEFGRWRRSPEVRRRVPRDPGLLAG